MLANDPLWYKDALIYEVHVRAFNDVAGEGTGNFLGLTRKLDYLQDLGVTAIWLLPFYPSPLKDDGYDIADYCDIHADYGSLRDFKEFMKEAHLRGLRVITELIINHTSDQHPWFQRARRSPPGSPLRDFYVWSESPEKYQEARIIFKDFEHSNWTWDPLAKAYYWHRFYYHQPDLNYDNKEVWQAIFPVVDFWMNLGVDGMRLDAVPYLFERDGTNCENLPETHDFLRSLRRHVDDHFPNRLLLAEANQWPEDAVAYFGDGDECQMAFHFPVMPRMFMAIHMEDRFPIIDIMNQTPAIPDNCQWSLFLRNHDELTLEMVTDEERDYMYRAYASEPRARVNLGIRRRLAPLLGNNRRRIELMNGLLFSLKGTPVIYYGEEIAMGDNIYLGDRNAVRTPMQWSGDRNGGFSRANPQKLYLPVIIDPEYHYEAVNVETQQNNPNSLLWWMKRLIALRKRHKAFGRGTLEFLLPENHKILAFLRRFEDECILVVANLSRFVQYVELDLSAHHGLVPVELFGRHSFPPIGKHPYLLTLGPHAFIWFSLEPKKDHLAGDQASAPASQLPILTMSGGWEDLFQSSARTDIERVLPAYMRQRRWFGGKARNIKSANIREAFRVPYSHTAAFITLVQVEYLDGESEHYVLPLSFAEGEQADQLLEDLPHNVVARLQGDSNGVLFDALGDGKFASAILEAIGRNQSFEEGLADVRTRAFGNFSALRGPEDVPLAPSIGKAEQSNTSIIYGNQLILKVFRRVEEGINPDLEIGYYLSQKMNFTHTAAVAGAIEYRRGRRSEPMTLAVLHGFIPNQGDAWQFTLNVLSSYYEMALAEKEPPPAPPAIHLVDLAEAGAPALTRDKIGGYLESARLLGQRTAEMHLALAAPSDDPSFVPEQFSRLYQRSIYQSMRNLCGRVFEQFRRNLPDLPEPVQEEAHLVLDAGEIPKRLRTILDGKINALRTRCHGDYHLGQVLYTGKDFFIIDFEGEPVRSFSERRIKRSPLRDVAGMIRSFHYAAHSASSGTGPGRGHLPGVIRPEDVAVLETWAQFWYTWVSASFLHAYQETAAAGSFLPTSREELKLLLDMYLLEKAIYELGYELNHRPDWVRIPLLGIRQLLERPV